MSFKITEICNNERQTKFSCDKENIVSSFIQNTSNNDEYKHLHKIRITTILPQLFSWSGYKSTFPGIYMKD